MIAGPQTGSPSHANHTGVWYNLDMRPCPNCGIAGNSFGCTNYIITYGPIDPASNYAPLTNEQLVGFLYSEIGRLHVQLREKEYQCASLLKVVVDLQGKGIIDHLYRALPLKDHQPDCPHGQSGWALCTCDRMTEGEKLDAAMGTGREGSET